MKDKNKFQTGNVITISIAHFIHDVYSSFLAPLLPLLIEKFSIFLSFASFLTIVQRLPSLLNPLVGYATDKLPIRYLLIVAPAITVICMSLIGIAPYVVVLIILLLTSGIGISLFHVPSPVMIKKVSGNRIGKGMSFYMLGGEIARSLGPLYILGAVSLWGLEGTYRLLPFGLIASALLFFRFRKIPISDAFKNKQKETGALEAVKTHIGIFAIISGIFFFTSLVKGSLTTFLPIFLTTKGETLWFGGIALSVVQFSGAAGTLFSGTISDRIGRKTTLLVMGISTPILMIIFLLINETLFVFPLLILIGFIMFAATPVLLAEVNSIDTEHPALINGVFMTINFLVSALALLIIGSLGDLFGLETAYIITAIIGILAIPFILRIPSE